MSRRDLNKESIRLWLGKLGLKEKWNKVRTWFLSLNLPEKRRTICEKISGLHLGERIKELDIRGKLKLLVSWQTVAAAMLLLLALSVLGNILTVGDHLTQMSGFLGGTFYVLIIVVVAGGVIYPTVRLIGEPVFSLYMLRDSTGRAKEKWCKKLAENLCKNGGLTEAEQNQVRGYLLCGNEADDKLIDFFKTRYAPEMDKCTKAAAKRAFVTTAISQNSFYDMLSMLVINIRLIHDIVYQCGFRPSNLRLVRLYLRVLSITLIAGGIEEMDLQQYLPLAAGGSFSRASGLVVASTVQGTMNAFTTFRVGVITKNLLLSDKAPATQERLRGQSYQEALGMLKSSGIQKSVLEMVGNSVNNLKKKVGEEIRNTPLYEGLIGITDEKETAEFRRLEELCSNLDSAAMEECVKIRDFIMENESYQHLKERFVRKAEERIMAIQRQNLDAMCRNLDKMTHREASELMDEVQLLDYPVDLLAPYIIRIQKRMEATAFRLDKKILGFFSK